MIWLFAVLIVLALGGVALVAAGVGAPMAEEYGDRPDALVPADRPLGAADLRRVRFSVTLRGYRMSEVDALLARLAAEAEDRHGAPVGARAETETVASPEPSTKRQIREPDSGTPRD
ncbi:DivIVA domain-containing protein [Nocardioides sp. DS6]|uniref:DivIVA domain-containing protein n=1 Tax=Nocardioides eburneus TaxID=3231482 RepID=A0ABV3SXC0_9ACTN